MDFKDKVRPGMRIHDADGRELGVVERIEGDEIVVGQHRVPHHAFERMDGDRLHLGQSGSQYFSGAGTGSGTQAGMTGGTRAGSTGGAQAGTSASQAGTWASGAGTRTGMESGRPPTSQAGMQTGGQAASQTGMQAGSRAGMDAGTRSGMTTGMEARSGAGTGMRDETRSEGDVTVPLMEERLEVEKRPTTLGEVQVRKEVTSEQVSVPVELTREEVRVRRENVEDRPVTDAEGAPFQEATIRVPVRGEEAVVNKQAFVTGEVVIDREQTTERQTVSDTVRREQVGVNHDRSVPIEHSAGGVQHWDDVRDTHRQGWEQRYGSSGRRWQDAEPGYHYAHEMSGDERFRGRSWNEVEPGLRSGYGDWSRRRGYADVPGEDAWQRLHQDVREAWEGAHARAR